jgi:cell division control protein 6
VLLGVANALDLTARALPRLAALAVAPVLVPFPSYSAAQLEALLTQRLAALPGPAFARQALRLLAKKVCGQLLWRRRVPCVWPCILRLSL